MSHNHGHHFRLRKNTKTCPSPISHAGFPNQIGDWRRALSFEVCRVRAANPHNEWAQQMGSTAARDAQPCALSCSGHHRAQDVVDAGGIASSIPPEPVVNVAVQAGGDQHLGRTAELRKLFIGQRRDVREIDIGIVSGGLTLRDPCHDSLLPLIQRPAEDRVGAHADELPAPR